MAIQFPNFLGVPVRTPDYSGFGDMVENYYKGKAMPKDDLIKAIQAEFARPNAEESLKSSKLSNSGKRLSNQHEQLNINQLMQEIKEKKAFEDQLRQALSGGAAGAMGANPGATGAAQQMPAGAPPMGNQPMGMNPALAQALGQQGGQQGLPAGATTDLQADQGLDITKMAPRYRKFDQMASGLPMSAYKGGDQSAPDQASAASSPMPQAAPEPEAPHEIVISAGQPHLAGIDAMWDNNPLSREFLKKKGYEKKQDIKFNAKTGQTTIITKYPSGTVTTQTVGTGVGGGTGEAPLTNKMVSKHQGIIAAVDVAVPVLKELGEMGSYPRQSIYRGGQYAEYEGKVSQAIDSVLSAFGLPSTNEGLKTIRDQIEIKTFETPSHYKKRMEKLIEDLKSRQKYSAGEVKKTLKNPPMSSGSDESDVQSMSDDELGEIANG